MLYIMAEGNQIKADFRIKIDFDKSTPQPSRVFRAMSDLIDSFECFDKDLIRSIDTKIDTVLLLEDIETGSLVAWLVSKLESTDDEVLKSGDWKKVLGAFLLKSKYITVDFLKDKTKITSKEEIENLQRNLLKAA